MAIQYLNNFTGIGVAQVFETAKTWFEKLLAMYDWNKKSSVEVQSDGLTIISKYYFTENSYLYVYSTRYGQNSFWNLKWKIVTPFGEDFLSDSSITYYSGAWGMSVKATRTSKGIGICLYNYGDSMGEQYDTGNPKDFNFMIGEYELNGETKRGLIYHNNKGTTTITNPLRYAIYSDDEHGTGVSQYTYIDADRKAVYVPLASTVTGAVFKDICLIRYSPANFVVEEIEGKDKWVCSIGLALRHTEEV